MGRNTTQRSCTAVQEKSVAVNEHPCVPIGGLDVRNDILYTFLLQKVTFYVQIVSVYIKRNKIKTFG
jgi:hypothetical protein